MSEIVLADTSVWVIHLRKGEKHHIQLLEQGLVVCHPFIIGELACGSLKNRKELLQLLDDLPKVDLLEHSEVMTFIEAHKLMSIGIGYVETHLLGSSLLSNTPLWILDKALMKSANFLNTEYNIRFKR